MRVGDFFYEFYGEDAETAAAALEDHAHPDGRTPQTGAFRWPACRSTASKRHTSGASGCCTRTEGRALRSKLEDDPKAAKGH